MSAGGVAEYGVTGFLEWHFVSTLTPPKTDSNRHFVGGGGTGAGSAQSCHYPFEELQEKFQGTYEKEEEEEKGKEGEGEGGGEA